MKTAAARPSKTLRFDRGAIPAATRRLREEARRRCLALAGAVEEFPWNAAGVYKVRGRIFASTGVREGAYEITFKPPPEERDDALGLPFVRVADYVGRHGWVQASVTRAGQLEILWPWIEAAHARLARPAAGKRARRP